MLQVWIPGIENLNNQGLIQLPSPSYNSMTQNSSGKIGKCYKGMLEYHLSNDPLTTNQVSVACWVKGDSFGSTNNIIFCANTSDSSDSKYYFSIISNTTLNFGINTAQTYSISYTFTTNTWYHVAATYDGDKIRLYINGELKGTSSSLNITPRTALNYGIMCRSYNSTGSSVCVWNQYYNDFRLYNSCLSPKEVHEISKGLVLHYPMNNIIGKKLAGFNSTKTSTTEYINLFDMTQIVDQYGLVPYTVSFDAKAAVSHNFDIYGSYGSNFKYIFSQTFINVTTEWKHFKYTFTPRLANSNGTWSGISLYGNYGSGAIISVRNVKFELGSVATYNGSIIDETTVYDCSGYCNNGTVTGSLQIVDDSPRYRKSTKFNGVNERINIPYTFTKSDQLTVSLWSYCTESNLGNKNIFSLEYNNYWQFNIANSNIYIRDSISGLTGTRRIVSFGTIPANKWNHLTAVYDKGTIKTYLNGELININTSTSTETLNWNNINWCCIGSAHQDGYYFDGNLSDFRIYSTALSEDDIKELYNTSAWVTNNGIVATYELNEE